MAKRKAIPQAVKELVLMEAGYHCGNPGCRQILTLELHHIEWVRDGGTNEQDNLIALCSNCHTQHTKGYIPKDAILTWKSLLISLNSSHRTTVDLLLVLYDEDKRVETTLDKKDMPPKFRFSGDGLPALAGLINAGIVEISRRFLGAGYWGPGGGPS